MATDWPLQPSWLRFTGLGGCRTGDWRCAGPAFRYQVDYAGRAAGGRCSRLYRIDARHNGSQQGKLMDDPRSGSEGSDSESLNPKTANIEPDVSKEPVPDDPFLSGAYQRIFRTAIVLSLLGTAAARFADRRSALGL